MICSSAALASPSGTIIGTLFMYIVDLYQVITKDPIPSKLKIIQISFLQTVKGVKYEARFFFGCR